MKNDFAALRIVWYQEPTITEAKTSSTSLGGTSIRMGDCENSFFKVPSMKNTENNLNARLSLGTKTLTETRESLDQDPDSFFQPESRQSAETIPDTNPRCFIQLFQEGVMPAAPLATTPMKTSTATREAMDQEEALSAMITRTMTRTREESDQDDGAMSYHAIPRF